jgi:glycosyltransferase involved in cell wall biosynthesis
MSEGDPLVTVIVPVFNGERWIERTLASASAQQYPRIEIVVVNDGSIDRTADVVAAAQSREPRIRLFSRPNAGLPATRNFAIAQGQGSLIAPLDADDLWHPEKLTRQVAAMQASPEIGLVYCWALEIDDNDLIIPPVRDGSNAHGRVLAELVATSNFIVSASNPLIRRSYLDAVGGYDASMRLGAEDWQFYLALARICEFAVVPAHLVGYRRTAGSMSKNVGAMQTAMENVSRWIMEKWPDMPENIKRQMIYRRNAFLAHLALTNNQFARALHYKMRSFEAQPAAFLTPSTLTFGARFLARLAGIRRASWPVRTPRIGFREFKA